MINSKKYTQVNNELIVPTRPVCVVKTWYDWLCAKELRCSKTIQNTNYYYGILYFIKYIFKY